MEFARTKSQVRITNRNQDNDIFGLKERNGMTGSITPSNSNYTPVNKGKNRNRSMDHTINSEFVCNNCLLKSKAQPMILKASINAKVDSGEGGGYIRGKQDMSNTLNKINIQTKVEEREQRTLIATKSVIKISVNPEKENFIEKVQSKPSFIHRDNEDPLKVRAMNRYNNNQNNLSSSCKFLRSENPDVTRYYEKCVDKSAPKDFTQYKNDKIPSSSEYKAGLKDQVIKGTVEKEKIKMINKRHEREFIEKTQEELAQQRKEEEFKNQRMKDEFIAKNKSMIVLKSKKSEIEKSKKDKEDEIKIRKDQLEAERLVREAKEKEFKNKQNMSEFLQKQVNEKNKINLIKDRKGELDNKSQKPWLNENCGCTAYQTCSMCRRQFPK